MDLKRQPGGGLQLLLIGAAISFLGNVVTLFGGSTGVLGLVSVVLTMIAYYQLRREDANFGRAFNLSIGIFVFTVLSVVVLAVFILVPILNAILIALVAVAASALSFGVTYYACKGVGNLAAGVGDTDTAALGELLIKVFFLCTAVTVVCTILGLIPLLGKLFTLLGKLAGLASLVGGGFMVYFFYRAMKLFN